MHEDDPVATDHLQERLAILHAMATVIERRQDLLEVIDSATDADAARQQIMGNFGLNDVQAVAVLDLQVRRFTDQERRRIGEEADEIRRRLNLA